MKIVLLWTDIVVWLLVAGAAVYAWKVARTPHLAATWKKAFASAPGAAAASVLSLFVVIGVVDSLHYRPLLKSGPGAEAAYAPETKSALDALLVLQAEGRERSYSAPLAWHAHEKEAITEGGNTQRVYPRLAHGGAHLQDPERDWAGDVTRRAAIGALAGLLAFAAVTFAGIHVAAWRKNKPAAQLWEWIRIGCTRFPWRTVLFTLGAVFVVAGIVLSLSREYHVFGTDRTGNDLMYVVLKSIRTALVIGTMSTLVTMPIAVGLGIVAGYVRGWIDEAIQYVYTVINSIPYVLLIASAVLILVVFIDNHPDIFATAAERTDARLFFLCVILGMTSWTDLCRLIRGEVIKLREAEYIQAAQAFGVSVWRILSVHLLPNVMHLILISIVINFSGLVLAEAVLSYVGIGVDPSMQSFGTLINTSRLELSREPTIWWTLATAFTFMFTLVLSANIFADAIRDAFDPRSVHR
jgi:peptide/nickel transport system permease protein